MIRNALSSMREVRVCTDLRVSVILFLPCIVNQNLVWEDTNINNLSLIINTKQIITITTNWNDYQNQRTIPYVIGFSLIIIVIVRVSYSDDGGDDDCDGNRDGDDTDDACALRVLLGVTKLHWFFFSSLFSLCLFSSLFLFCIQIWSKWKLNHARVLFSLKTYCSGVNVIADYNDDVDVVDVKFDRTIDE